jgi:hypothetical protein
MKAQRDMGFTTADFDMDGYPDFWSGTGGPKWDGLLPNVLYRITPDGMGGLLFQDITLASGLLASGASRSHGSAVGDYDRDGDLDFYQNDGGLGFDPTTLETNSLWASRGNGNHWVEVSVEGRISNRTGVGLRGFVHTPAGMVHRWLSVGKGFANTDDHTLHFGLGAQSVIDRLELHWPSGIVQTVHGLASDTLHDLVETGLVLEGPHGLGKTSRLRIAGPDSAPALLLASNAGAQDTWIPVVGSTLGLAAPIVSLGTLTLPAGKPLDLEWVPQDPSLVGNKLWMQAFVGTISDGILTNVVLLEIQ